MDAKSRRRKRLKQLLDMAKAYRDISGRELARRLDRDPGRIIPESGIPKLDLVVRLANLLDWPVQDVVTYIFPQSEASEPAEGAGTFEGLQIASRRAHVDGQYSRAVALAQHAYAIAETAEQRALACNREAVAWDGLGRYLTALEAAQRGLRETSGSTDVGRILESNLANSYYTIGALTEARSIARDLIDWYIEHPAEKQRDRATQAFALYVRGNTIRRMLSDVPTLPRLYSEHAKHDLVEARRQYRQLAKDYEDDSYAGIANTCHGSILELQVRLGEQNPADALDEILAGLDAVVDPSQVPRGDWLESFGWWCIFGCNIALRHLSDERHVQRLMAVFTGKADDIARRLGNWALRERVFSMHYERNERVAEVTGREMPIVLDQDDLQALVGTMGRFPAFRPRGLKLLQAARIVHND